VRSELENHDKRIGCLTQWLADIGNTRLKLAVLRDGKLSAMRAMEYGGRSSKILAGLRAMRGESRGNEPTEVIAVSVAGAKLEREFARCVERAFGAPTRFVRSTTLMPPLAIGYDEPWRLGADRWVAAVAGFHEFGGRRDVIVIDAGTALTIDVVTRAAKHLGGLIVPGPSMMVNSLLERTRGIRVRAAARGRIAGAKKFTPFATNTRAAIESGALYAAAGLIDRVARETRQKLARAPAVLLTGGAAHALSPLVRVRHSIVDDLVLRGLVHFANAAVEPREQRASAARSSRTGLKPKRSTRSAR
jgi:type III pantothenate kinase